MYRLPLISLLGGLAWLLLTAAVLAQANANGVDQPAGGETLAGQIIVVGTATDPNYLRYELAFWQEARPEAGWIVFAEGNQPVVADTLAVWDTTVGREQGAPIFPDGRYRLRLRVVRTDYNYDEYFVNELIIQNGEPTPTPTAVGTAVAPVVTLPATGQGFGVATALPSLTPFPTPTVPTIVQPPAADSGGPTDEAAADRGLLERLRSIEVSQFSRAFWLGTRLTALLFGGVAVYLLLRAVGRRLWRRYWTGRQAKPAATESNHD